MQENEIDVTAIPDEYTESSHYLESAPPYIPPVENELQSLVDLGKQALITFSEQGNAERTLQMERMRIQEKQLQFEGTAFKFKAVITGAGMLGLLTIAAGLFFHPSNPDHAAGMQLLSHLGALVAGLLGGYGWEKVNQ
ncbi:MAG: hypothetical protein Q7T32_08170 [Moraxellaceae bacterium]|nr:hypothetical protein [Moraxellaceae bacterium]